MAADNVVILPVRRRVGKNVNEPRDGVRRGMRSSRLGGGRSIVPASYASRPRRSDRRRLSLRQYSPRRRARRVPGRVPGRVPVRVSTTGLSGFRAVNRNGPLTRENVGFKHHRGTGLAFLAGWVAEVGLASHGWILVMRNSPIDLQLQEAHDAQHVAGRRAPKPRKAGEFCADGGVGNHQATLLCTCPTELEAGDAAVSVNLVGGG